MLSLDDVLHSLAEAELGETARLLRRHNVEGGRRSPRTHDPKRLGAVIEGMLASFDEARAEPLLHDLAGIAPDLGRAAAAWIKAGGSPLADLARDFLRILPQPTLFSPAGEGARALLSLAGKEKPIRVRRLAIERLGRLGALPEIKRLAEHLDEAPAQVGETILVALDRCRPDEAIAMGLRLLRSDDLERARAAAAFFGRLGARGFPSLRAGFEAGGALSATAKACSPVLVHRFPGRIAAWCATKARLSTPLQRRRAISRIVRLDRASRDLDREARLPWLRKSWAILEERLVDDQPAVRADTLRALAHTGYPSFAGQAVSFLSDSSPFVRTVALALLEKSGRVEALPRIASLLSEDAEEIRHAAVAAILSIGRGTDAWRGPIVRLLGKRKSPAGAKRAALRIVGELGGPEEIPLIRSLLHDRDESIRAGALRTIAAVDILAAEELALAQLTSPSEEVAASALEIVSKTRAGGRLVDVCLAKLPEARGGSGALLVRRILRDAPERIDETLALAARSRSFRARGIAAGILGRRRLATSRPILASLAGDPHPAVRLAAIRSLRKGFGDTAGARTALRDDDPAVRQGALAIVQDEDDPDLLEELVALTADPDEEVRRDSLIALARFDDPRLFGLIASAMGDEDEKVREAAEEILEEEHGPVPALARGRDGMAGEEVCRFLRGRADGVNRWAGRIGRELLGRTVTVRQTRRGVGFTHSKSKRVIIHVNDRPVTGEHRHGEEIMRAIALHEIGHHLYDFGARGFRTMKGIARSDGLDEIFNILLDERLERKLRARRPLFGACFDRLASYAFAQDGEEIDLGEYARLVDLPPERLAGAIREKRLPGVLLRPAKEGETRKVVLRAHETLSIPGLVPSLNAFLCALRCGFSPEIIPDPAIGRALALVPSNLKDLSHAEVLQAARLIGDEIGRTPKHEREIRLLRKRMKNFRTMLRGLERALRRLRPPADPEGKAERSGRPGKPSAENRILRALFGEGAGRPPAARRGKPPVGKEESEFDFLTREKILPFEPEGHKALVASVREHIRVLRPYLERLGTRLVEENASRRGRRIDIACARRSAVLPTPNMLVHARSEIFPNAYIGVLIDRSGSMSGSKIRIAKAFGALVAESACGLRGLDGHVNAFDDTTFFRMGGFRRSAVASLEAGAGNNDAGGLWLAARLAFESRRKNKLLIMISDGQPTECTFEALRNLVETLTVRHGVVCAQVAVDRLERVAFPHFVDLSLYPLGEAVARFGRLLVRLTSGWR